jgi:hypothetical protein
LRKAAQSDGTPLDRLHLIVDTAAAYFGERTNFRSVLRQMQGGSAILGPVLDAFAEDVYGRYADALKLMTDLIRQGQQAGEIRAGDAGGLAHLASVLINEYGLADVALAPSEFRAVFDGALRAPPLC